MVSSTHTAPVNPPPPTLVKEHSENLVKVTENGSVDKESLPPIQAMKQLLEGRTEFLKHQP